MEATVEFFSAKLFIILYKMVLILESIDDTLGRIN